MRRRAQNVVEYALIFAIVAVAALMLSNRIDLKKVRDYVFVRPSSQTNPSHIRIEPMTDR